MWYIANANSTPSHVDVFYLSMCSSDLLYMSVVSYTIYHLFGVLVLHLGFNFVSNVSYFVQGSFIFSKLNLIAVFYKKIC